MEYKPLYAVLLLITLAAPYVGGPIIALNETRFTKWGWLEEEGKQEGKQEAKVNVPITWYKADINLS